MTIPFTHFSSDFSFGNTRRAGLLDWCVGLMTVLLCTPAIAAENPRAVQTGPARRVIAGDDSKRTVAMIAPNGAIEWKFNTGRIPVLHLLPNGHLLCQ